MESRLKIARAYLDAFFDGDLTTSGEYLDPNFDFHGPLSHYRSPDDFLNGSNAFLATLRPGWREVAAFENPGEVLVLYDLTFRDGTEIRVANHLVFTDNRIGRETVVFDSALVPKP